jgi:predicted P-loop ATPase
MKKSKSLNWAPIVGSAMEQFVAVAEVPMVAAPTEDPSRPVDLEDFRKRLREIRREPTRSIVQAILAGRAPTPPPEKRQQGQPSRYVAWRHVTGALAAKAEDWESSEALISVARPSWMQEVAESTGDATQWETIQKLFSDARAGMPYHRAQKQAQREANRDLFRKMIQERDPTWKPSEPVQEDVQPEAPEATDAGFEPEEPTLNPSEPSVASTSAAGGATEAPVRSPPQTSDSSPAVKRDWAVGLKLRENKDGDVVPVSCPENVSLMLMNSPEWTGVFRYNELQQCVEVWPGPLTVMKRWITDADISNTCDWFGREFDFKISDAVMWSRINAVARAQSYDPLKDYLNGLVWDGVQRVPTWLRRYLGAATTNLAGEDITEHVDVVSLRWLVSAVARALHPGCKVDVVLEFEGGQGIGKSTALSILGGEFFSDAAIDIHNKDAAMYAAQYWIIELGELETLKRSEATAQKAFFSKQFDDYRPPYGRSTIHSLRRCVFVGTTNTDDYLHDSTGNRRHAPVKCLQVDLEALKRDRDQLWAEAVALYRAGVQYHMTKAEAAVAEKQAAERAAPDMTMEAIEEWFARLPMDQRPTEVRTYDICVKALDEGPTRGIEIRIGHALRKLGFVAFRRRDEGNQIRMYKTPARLLQIQGRAPNIQMDMAMAKATKPGLA